MSFKASTNHQLSASSFSEGEELVFQQLYEENSELRNELEMRMQ